MYFPLGKYMTGVARVKPGPASGRASRAVTRRWRQVRPGGASGLSFDALCRRISLLVVRSAVMVMPGSTVTWQVSVAVSVWGGPAARSMTRLLSSCLGSTDG